MKPRTLLPLLFVVAACENKPETKPAAPEPSASTAAKESAPSKYTKVARADFNRVAAELAMPLFWSADTNKNNALDASELVVYWGLDPAAKLTDYVDAKGVFTPKMDEAYAAISKRQAEPLKGDARKEAVAKELAQGRVTLLSTDLSKSSAEEKKFVQQIFELATTIERLYGAQLGEDKLGAKIPADDTASKSMFWRAQGIQCTAPATKDDKSCTAVADPPKTKVSGLYPESFLGNDKFCETLNKSADKKIMDPFQVVGGELGKPTATAYTEAFKADMTKASQQLKAAADALGDKEADLKSYLLADSQAFMDNNWWPADEAWAKMGPKNSKFYIRVAPDENYREPCSTKALFHVSFGLINQGSLKWQTKLDPIKGDMEKALAELAGAPYKARDVQFKLPDFTDIILNAGDSRTEFGATIGQSLPNYGPVGNGGRGRTVAMTNFYTDPDSLQSGRETTQSLLCGSTMDKYTDDPEPLLVSTVLHEAAHNLGPAHQYAVNGKDDRQIFTGPLAATLEELKAQTAALYFQDWLVEKKELTQAEANKGHVRDLVWSFGHISRGMYDGEKHPNNYSQLAAIQLGWFMKDGAVVWKADQNAANGKDKGCFELDLTKLAPSVKGLMTEIAQIKGKGDKARADKLIKDYVDVTGDKANVHKTITERITRAPKASFVYAAKLD